MILFALGMASFIFLGTLIGGSVIFFVLLAKNILVGLYKGMLKPLYINHIRPFLKFVFKI